MTRPLEQTAPAREQLRPVLGDDVVDQLTSRQCGRILGATFCAARSELERAHRHDRQLELEPAGRQ